MQAVRTPESMEMDGCPNSKCHHAMYECWVPALKPDETGHLRVIAEVGYDHTKSTGYGNNKKDKIQNMMAFYPRAGLMVEALETDTALIYSWMCTAGAHGCLQEHCSGFAKSITCTNIGTSCASSSHLFWLWNSTLRSA